MIVACWSMLALLAGCHAPDDLAHLGITDMRARFQHTGATDGTSTSVEFSWPLPADHCPQVGQVSVTLGGVEMDGDTQGRASDSAGSSGQHLGYSDEKQGCIHHARFTLPPEAAPREHGDQTLILKDPSAEISVRFESPFKPRHLTPNVALLLVGTGAKIRFTSTDGLPLLDAAGWLGVDPDHASDIPVEIAATDFQVRIPDGLSPGQYVLGVTASSNVLKGDCPFEQCVAVVGNRFIRQIEVE